MPRILIGNIKGPKGDTGPQGVQGEPGIKGDPGPQGPDGIQGETGPQGIQGIQGEQGPQGVKGEQGPRGEKGDPFYISKVYSSINAMHLAYSTDDVPVGGFIVIDTGNVDDEDNAKLFIKGNTQYEYITDLSGAQGVQGPQGPQGDQGPQGEQGIQGIQGIQGPDGYTPVKGIDYWTTTDKHEIVNEAVTMLPTVYASSAIPSESVGKNGDIWLRVY